MNTISHAAAIAGIEDLLHDLEASASSESGNPQEASISEGDIEPKVKGKGRNKPAADKTDKTEKPAKPKTAGKGKKKPVDAPEAAGDTEGAPVQEQSAAEPVDAPVELLPEPPALVLVENTDAQPAPVETQPAADAQPKPKRIYFGRNKLALLEHRVGGDLDKLLVLKVEDAELEGDAFTAKVTETKALIKSLGSKVQNRATNLIEFCSGKRTTLNPVIETALRLLAKDRKLESGDKGNLHVKLIGRPYSPAAARAMGNNTLNMLRSLGLIREVEKQKFEPSEESTLLALVSDRLALSFVDNGEAVAEAEAREEEERLKRALPVEDNSQSLADANPEQPKTPDAPVADELSALVDGLVAQAQSAELKELEALF